MTVRQPKKGPSVRLTTDAHKALKNKANQVYQETDRPVTIVELVEWLVTTHLGDYPVK